MPRATSSSSGRTITRCCAVPAGYVQSVAESSFDAWIKFYRQDENSPNAVVSYYAKGALVALALDLTLRERRRIARRPDARAVAAPRRRRASACPRTASRRSRPSSPAATCRISSRATSRAPRSRRSPRCCADSASTLNLRPADGHADRGGKAGPQGARRRARGGVARGEPRGRRGGHAPARLRRRTGRAGGTRRRRRGRRDRRPPRVGRRHREAAAQEARGRDARRCTRSGATSSSRPQLTLAAAPLDTCWLALDAGADDARRGSPRRLARQRCVACVATA